MYCGWNLKLTIDTKIAFNIVWVKPYGNIACQVCFLGGNVEAGFG